MQAGNRNLWGKGRLEARPWAQEVTTCLCMLGAVWAAAGCTEAIVVCSDPELYMGVGRVHTIGTRSSAVV